MKKLFKIVSVENLAKFLFKDIPKGASSKASQQESAEYYNKLSSPRTKLNLLELSSRVLKYESTKRIKINHKGGYLYGALCEALIGKSLNDVSDKEKKIVFKALGNLENNGLRVNKFSKRCSVSLKKDTIVLYIDGKDAGQYSFVNKKEGGDLNNHKNNNEVKKDDIIENKNEKLWENENLFSEFSEKKNLILKEMMDILQNKLSILKPKNKEVAIDYYSSIIDIFSTFMAGGSEHRKSLEKVFGEFENFMEIDSTYIKLKKDFFDFYDQGYILNKPYSEFISSYESKKSGKYLEGEAKLLYPIERGFESLGTWKLEKIGSEKIETYPVLKELYESVVDENFLKKDVKTYTINEENFPVLGFSVGRIVAFNNGNTETSKATKVNELSHYITNKYFYEKLKLNDIFSGFAPSFGLKIQSHMEANEFLSDVSSINQSPQDFLRILSVGSAIKNYRFSYEFAKIQLSEMIDSSTSINESEKNALKSSINDEKLFKVIMFFEGENGRFHKIIKKIINEFSVEIKDTYMTEGKRIVEHLKNK